MEMLPTTKDRDVAERDECHTGQIGLRAYGPEDHLSPTPLWECEGIMGLHRGVVHEVDLQRLGQHAGEATTAHAPMLERNPK